MSGEHTPTPWEFRLVGEAYHVSQVNSGAWFLDIGLGCPVSELAYPLDTFADFEANVTMIKSRINSHDALVEALQKIVNNWDDLHPKDRHQAREALAKAGAQ